MEFEKIESFLKNLMSSWGAARVYNVEHKLFRESLDRTYDSLENVLSDKNEFVVGILGQELASGKNIFFELSKKITQPIEYLKKINIEKIAFYRGITKEELSKFISFLVAPEEKNRFSPQEHLLRYGIKNIEVNKIKVDAKNFSGQGEPEKNKLVYYESCLQKLSQSLGALISDDSVDTLSLKFIANDIMENLSDKYQSFFKLRQTKNYDTITFMHLLNVSILSIYFSHELGFNRDDCLDIGIAGLFHDIGKLYIAKKILQKKDKLSDEEFGKVKNHSILGAEILLRHVETLTVLPVVVAFEHHLRYDLEGYPRLFFRHKLHVASSIVAICDVYDALMSRRSYKGSYLPERIYEIMIKDKGKRFDPNLLDKFFKLMGVWPKGTIVELINKKIGVVRSQNEGDMFSPVIEMISEDKGRLVDLKLKRDIKIKRTLDPLGEGKDYINLI